MNQIMTGNSFANRMPRCACDQFSCLTVTKRRKCPLNVKFREQSMLPEINVCRREATALRRQTLTDRRSPAIFFTSFLSLTSVQKSFLPFCDNPPPGNLIEKFARLRPFPIIHRLLAIAPPSISSPEFARVHPTSPEFTRVRSSLPFSFSCFRTFVIGLPLIKFAESEITRRITKTRNNESTKKCSIIPRPKF